METIFNVQRKYRNFGLEVTIDVIKVFNPVASNAIVLGLYRPPNVKQEWFHFVNDLVMELLPYGNLIMIGDLNCN